MKEKTSHTVERAALIEDVNVMLPYSKVGISSYPVDQNRAVALESVVADLQHQILSLCIIITVDVIQEPSVGEQTSLTYGIPQRRPQTGLGPGADPRGTEG